MKFIDPWYYQCDEVVDDEEEPCCLECGLDYFTVCECGSEQYIPFACLLDHLTVNELMEDHHNGLE